MAIAEWEEHCRRRIFGGAQVFPMLHNAYHLYARSIPHLVISADRVCHGAEDSVREFPVNHGYAWRNGMHQHCVLQVKTQIAAQGTRESADVNQRGSNQHRADGNLRAEQQVSERNPPT